MLVGRAMVDSLIFIDGDRIVEQGPPALFERARIDKGDIHMSNSVVQRIENALRGAFIGDRLSE